MKVEVAALYSLSLIVHTAFVDIKSLERLRKLSASGACLAVGLQHITLIISRYLYSRPHSLLRQYK